MVDAVPNDRVVVDVPNDDVLVLFTFPNPELKADIPPNTGFSDVLPNILPGAFIGLIPKADETTGFVCKVGVSFEDSSLLLEFIIFVGAELKDGADETAPNKLDG